MRIKMDDIVAIEKPRKDTFKISWKMTSWCNYRCPYCYMAKEVAKGDNQTPFDKILAIADRLDKLIELQCTDKKYVSLHLIGGEVGYYDLVQVLSRIKSRKLGSVIIATNLSNSLSYWTKLKLYEERRKLVNSAFKLNIIASFHLDQCNREEFIHKAILLKAKVKCVVNDDNLEIYRPYFDRLLASGNTIQCTVERDNSNSCAGSIQNPKSQEYVDFLNKDLSKKDSVYFIVTLKNGVKVPYYSNIELINSIDIGGLDPDGFLCTAGLDGIRIAQSGSLRRAGCRYASIHELGNILDEDIWDKLPKDPWICKTEEADKNGIKYKKFCTCFGNASMYRNERN